MHVVCTQCGATTFQGVRECFLLFADSAAHEPQRGRGSLFNSICVVQMESFSGTIGFALASFGLTFPNQYAKAVSNK